MKKAADRRIKILCGLARAVIFEMAEQAVCAAQNAAKHRCVPHSGKWNVCFGRAT